MKTRTLLVASLIANAALAGTTAYVYHQIAAPADGPAGEMISAGVANPDPASDSADGLPRFGPVREMLLASPEAGQRPELVDLETGRRITEPDFQFFGRNAKALTAWIQANSLDISGIVHEGRDMFCVGYYLAVVPVDSRRWTEATPAEVLASPELAHIRDPKRSVIMPAQAQTDTFLFRTHEGTTGIMRILGASADRRTVKIHCKLVQPGAAPPAPLARFN